MENNKKKRKVERKIHYREKSCRRAIVIYKKVCVGGLCRHFFLNHHSEKRG